MQTKIKETFFHHQMLDYKCVKLRVSEAKPSDVSLRHLTQASSPPEQWRTKYCRPQRSWKWTDTGNLGGLSEERYRHVSDESEFHNRSSCPLLIAMFALHLPLMLVYTNECQKENATHLQELVKTFVLIDIHG